MIIGTVTALMILFGGGGDFSFEKAFEPFIKDAVKDKARYEQIVDLTKGADEDVKAFQKELEDEWGKQLITLLTDYDASEDDFRSFRGKADASRIKLQQGLLDARFGMIELMTADEWVAMYEAIEKKAEKDK
jgi:hypothetical protein